MTNKLNKEFRILSNQLVDTKIHVCIKQWTRVHQYGNITICSYTYTNVILYYTHVVLAKLVGESLLRAYFKHSSLREHNRSIYNLYNGNRPIPKKKIGNSISIKIKLIYIEYFVELLYYKNEL